MASDVENVGGIGISLEIDDKTENQISAIETRLLELTQPRKILVELGTPTGHGGNVQPGQSDVEDRISRSLNRSLDKFTAALSDLKIKIDPDSISSLARAIREAMQEPASGPGAYSSPKLTALTGAVARGTAPTSSAARIDETAKGVARGEILFDRTYASQRRSSSGGAPRRGRAEPISGAPETTPPPRRKNAFEEAAERARAIADETVRPEPLYAKQRQKVSADRGPNPRIQERPVAPRLVTLTADREQESLRSRGRSMMRTDRYALRVPVRGSAPHPGELEHINAFLIGKETEPERTPRWRIPVPARTLIEDPRDPLFVPPFRAEPPVPEGLHTPGRPGMPALPARRIEPGNRPVQKTADGKLREEPAPYSSRDAVLANLEKRLAVARTHGTKETVAQLEQERRARMQVLERGEPRGARYAADADILTRIFSEITHPGAALIGLAPEEPSYPSGFQPAERDTYGPHRPVYGPGIPPGISPRLSGYDRSRAMFGMGLGGDITARQRMDSRIRTQFAAEQRASGYQAPREGTVVGPGGESVSSGRLVPRAVVGSKYQEMPQLPFGFESEPTGAAIARVVERATSAIYGGATEGPDAALLGYYRLIAPGRVDLSKLPERAGETDEERRRFVENLRLPARSDLMESTVERLGVRGASEFRLPEDFEIPALAGQKVSRVPRDVAFLEEVARELGLDSIDQLFYRQSGDARREAKVRKAQEHLASLPAGHAIAPESGGRLLGQGPPTVEPGDLPQMYATGRFEPKPTEEIARRETFGISTGRPLETGPRGLRMLEVEHRARRVINKRMQRHGPTLKEKRPGYLSPATATKPAQWVDPAAQEYIKNFALAQIQGEDIPWDDPEFTTLGNMLFLRSLGGRDERSGKYRDTDQYPIISADDIRKYIFPQFATTGLVPPRWSGRVGVPSSYHAIPGTQREYQEGLKTRWARRYGTVPRAAQMLIGATMGQLREERGGFQRPLGIEPGYSYGGTGELFERGVRRNMADERELMRSRPPIAEVGRPEIGGMRYSAQATLLRNLEEREARLRHQAELADYERRKAEVGEEFVEYKPTAFPSVREPAVRGPGGRDIPLSLAPEGRAQLTGRTTWRTLAHGEGTDESLGSNLEEVRARKRAALQLTAEEPKTESFKTRPIPEQRAVRYEATVAQTILAREEAQELQQLVLERKAGRREKKRYRALLPREFGGRGQIEDLEASAAKQREELTAPRADTVQDRVAAGDREGAAKILRQERDRVIERERRRFLADQSTGTKKLTSMKQLSPAQSAQWSGKLALINKRFGEQIDALESGETPARAERVTGDVAIPTRPLQDRVEAAAAVEPTPHTRLEEARRIESDPERLRQWREEYARATGGGGAGAATPPPGGGSFTGKVTLDGQPIHVIVDEVTKASAIESAIGKIKATIARPEKKAAAAKKPEEEAAAKKTKPEVPEFATAYGPSGGAKPVRAFGPTLTGAGAGGPEAAYEIELARMKSETNVEARQAAQQLQAAEAKSRSEKQAADRQRELEKKLPVRQKLIENEYQGLHALAAESVVGLDDDPTRLHALRGVAMERAEPRYQEIVDRAAEIFKAQSERYTEPKYAWQATLNELERQSAAGLIPEGLFVGNEEQDLRRDVERKLVPAPAPEAGEVEQPLLTKAAALARRLGQDVPKVQRGAPRGVTAEGLDYGTKTVTRVDDTGAETEEEVPATLADYLSQQKAAVTTAQRGLPVRALSTSMIQSFATAFGPYNRVQQRAKLADSLGATFRAEERKLAGAQEGRRDIQPKLLAALSAQLETVSAGRGTAETAANIDTLTDTIAELDQYERDQIETVKASKEAYDKQVASVVTASDQMQHFAATFAGGIAGGIVGSFAGMIAQPIMQAFTAAVTEIGGPIVDAVLGYSMTRSRTMAELAQGTEAAGGIGAVAFAQKYQFAPTAVRQEAGAPAIAQAETIAASKRLEEVRDLFRTVEGMQAGPAQALTTSAGGILGSQVGAEYKSIAELLNSEVSSQNRVMTDFSRLTNEQGQYVGGSQSIATMPWQVTTGTGLPTQGQDQESLKWVDWVNEFLGEKPKYQFRVGTDEERMAAQSGMYEAKLGGMSAAGFVAVNQENGKLVTATADYIDVLNEVKNSFARINADALLEQMQPQMRAQTQQMEWQKNYQLETTIPQQRGMQWLSNPLMPYGSTWMPGQQGIGFGNLSAAVSGAYTNPDMSIAVSNAQQALGNVPPQILPMGYDAGGASPAKYSVPAAATQSFNQYKSVAVNAFNEVQRAAEAGIRALEKAGVPPATIDSLRQYAAQAVAIQAQMAAIQTGRAETKYQHSLFMANRALTDAKQLAGQIGRQAGSNVGYYERQLMLINRQNQALSLQLQKRQILTQLALARFQVPGETGEERYARREEMEIAAGIQQKQLGLATQAFQTEIKLVDEQNLRAVQDAAYALQELKLDYQAQKMMEGLQNALALVQAASQSLLPEAQVFVEFKNNYEQFMVGIATDIAARTEENMMDVLTTVRESIANDPVMSQIFGMTAKAKPSSGTTPQFGNQTNTGFNLTQVSKTVIDNRQVNPTIDIKVDTKTLSPEQVDDLIRQITAQMNRIAQLVGLRPVAQ